MRPLTRNAILVLLISNLYMIEHISFTRRVLAANACKNDIRSSTEKHGLSRLMPDVG